MNLVEEIKRTSLAWIARVESAAESVGRADVAEALRLDLARAISDPRIRVVVCGEWSTGKSTLINALVGVPGLLPSDVGPCTSYITVLERGPLEQYEVRRDGVDTSLLRSDFLNLAGAKEGDSSIQQLRVVAPVAWPDDHFIVIDTPGLEDITKSRSEVTLKFLPQADVIILVMSAVSGVKGTVESFVRNQLTPRELRRVIPVLNQKDHINSDEEVSKRLAACSAMLEAQLAGAVWVATNANCAVRDADSGIPALRAAISDVVRKERLEILEQRFVRSARGTLDDLASRIAAEEASLSLTEHEAERRLTDFRRNVAETARANNEAFKKARAIIAGEIDSWLKTVPSGVQEVQSAAIVRIRSLDSHEALRAYINTDELGRSLASELRSLCGGLEAVVESAVGRAGKEVLSEQLVSPKIQTVDLDGAIQPVNSIFRDVPTVVVSLLEVIIADVLLPGGPIMALLAKLGLGGIIERLRGLDSLRTLMPTEFIRSKLEEAVIESLSQFHEHVVSTLRAAAKEASDEALNEIRAALERRATSVEAGLEDARATLSLERSHIETRQKLLVICRHDIKRLSKELPDSVA